MNRLLRFGRWIANRLKDLFYGPGNTHADLGRILAGLGGASVIGAAIWNVHLHQPVSLMELGTGYAAVITASAGFLAAKAYQQQQSVRATLARPSPTGDENATTDR